MVNDDDIITTHLERDQEERADWVEMVTKLQEELARLREMVGLDYHDAYMEQMRLSARLRAELEHQKNGLRHQVPDNGGMMDVPCEDYEQYVVGELTRLRDSNWSNLADSQRYRAERDEAQALADENEQDAWKAMQERDEALEALRAIRDDAVDEYAVADAVLSNDYRVGNEWKRFMNRPSEPMKLVHHQGFVHSADVTCPKCPESRIDD